MPDAFTSWHLGSSYSLPCNAFLSSSSSKVLAPLGDLHCEAFMAHLPDSLSLIPLLCHYILSQSFVCMSACALRQGAPWKLVLIFWCLSGIGKNAKSPWSAFKAIIAVFSPAFSLATLIFLPAFIPSQPNLFFCSSQTQTQEKTFLCKVDKLICKKG